MPFDAVLSSARADRQLSRGEWRALKDALASEEPTPGRSDNADELVRFVYEGAAPKRVRDDADRFLKERGYHMWFGDFDALNGAERTARAELAIDRHVSTEDEVFAALSRTVGDERSELHVAVCDGGFDVSHPVIAARLWANAGEIPGNGLDDDGNGFADDVHGWDVAENDAGLADNTAKPDHGNHVMGIAGQGTSRLRCQGIRTYAKKATPATIEQALRYACESGARVVNMSFKVDKADEVAAALTVIDEFPDVLFVKSAGNDGRDLSRYAAGTYLSREARDNLVVVANHQSNGTRRRNSNWGDQEAHLAAWGSGVVSTGLSGAFVRKTGTSMAAPLVTNTAAKMKLLCDALTPKQLTHLMGATVDESTRWETRVISGGMLNADRAMKAAAWQELALAGKSAADIARELKLDGAELERVRDAVAGLPA